VGRGKLRVLVFLLACPAFAGCTSGTIHAPTKSSAHVEASPTGTQSSAPANDDVAPPTLSGSFVMDLTWVSHTTGWALAASPCSEGLCPQVARTDDGGATWVSLPAPPASIQNGYVDCARQACVTNIRFASPSVGYLFGPVLLLTRDGGRTWVREPGPPVEDLEPGSGTVLRLVYDHDGCPGPCRRTLQQAAAGSNDWRTLRSFGALAAGSAQVIRTGTVVYVPIYGNPAWGAGDQHASSSGPWTPEARGAS